MSLFQEVRTALVEAIVRSLDDEDMTWETAAPPVEGWRMLRRANERGVESIIFVAIDGMIGISLGANQLTTHISDSQYFNEDYRAVREAFERAWLAVEP